MQTPESSFERRGDEGARTRRSPTSSSTARVFWTNLAAQPRLLLRRPLFAGCCRISSRRCSRSSRSWSAFRRRPAWQCFVVAAALAQMLIFIIGTPYTWHGGGGSVGNRYFMSAYGLLLFVMPVLPRLWMAFVPWVVGALFTAPLVLNPFYASFYPGSYAQARAAALAAGRADARLRLADQHRRVARRGCGSATSQGSKDPGFQIYFFDDNAYLPGRRQDLLGQGGVARGVPDQDRQADVARRADADRRRRRHRRRRDRRPAHAARCRSRPASSSACSSASSPGSSIRATWPVWTASVSSSRGFVPIFHEAGIDRHPLSRRACRSDADRVMALTPTARA